MPKRPAPPSSPGFTIGRAAFDRISAVEGLRRDTASEAMFAAFDHRNLSAEERRRAIQARHGVKVVLHGKDSHTQSAARVSSSPRRRIAG
jgi:hypothetical protein